MTDKQNNRAETLGEMAGEILRRMVREVLVRKPGGHLVESTLRQIDLRLPLVLRGDDAEPKRFATRLARTIERQLDDAVQQAAAFRPGRTYCHRCEGSTCEHAVPPTCRHVFAGYAPTGIPRWEDFAQLCLDLKHPEVDRLYESPPALVTLVQERAELRGGLLEAFRNGQYELVGQVIAGFFHVRGPVQQGRNVLALTVQAAASRTRRGALRLGLNLLGRSPGGEELNALWEAESELPWRRAVRWAQSALQSIRPRKSPRSGAVTDPEVERRVAGIMRGLARRLERDQRARSRRTRHAEKRHDSGERPTRKALDDAREAGEDAFMVDVRSGTIVVLGDRGRTHFFTGSGQLVSSVRYSRDAIARKIKLEKWRAAREEERKKLLAELTE
jgi:hypothetical protein